ncbi:tetratricopeptide repeat protein [Paraburkholderia sp. UYCP14C]|nr:tetratricopeptide repeat protein [Paraburkholderia sp. UYCP14C]
MREVCETLIALRREDELIPWTERALILSPNHPYFLALHAHALDLLGRHAEAAATWPHHPSRSHDPVLYRVRLGYSLMMAGNLEKAIQLLDEALRTVDSDNTHVRATAEQLLGEAMLKAGNSHGFAHWLARNESGNAASYRPIGIPGWAGEPDLHGKHVLVTHQLGFGDNFLLAACVADWQAAGASVMITCDPQVHTLMRASLRGCKVVSAPRPSRLHERLPDDVQARVETFAPHLHVTLLQLPLLKAGRSVSGYRFQPYVRAPLAKQQIAKGWARQLRQQHSGKSLVGLFWDCEQRHHPELSSEMRCWAKRRSLPVKTLDRVVTDPAVASRVHFVSLQHPLVEASAGAPVGNVSRYLPGIYHFDDTAACIGELDAVLAVDSGVANLAAMMGKPTCVPVNTSSDWRWGTQGATTRWIDGAKVLRQTHESNWDPVVQEAVAWLTG